MTLEEQRILWSLKLEHKISNMIDIDNQTGKLYVDFPWFKHFLIKQYQLLIEKDCNTNNFKYLERQFLLSILSTIEEVQPF